MDEVRISARRGRLGLRTLVVGLATVAGFALQSAPAGAYTGLPLWQCRGSALSVSVNGGNHVEPVLANGNPNTANGASPDRAQCVNSEAGMNNLPTPLGLPANFVTAATTHAITEISPELGPAIKQTAYAQGGVEGLALRLPAGGTVALGVAFANAAASAVCQNGAPVLNGTSQASGFTIGGTAVSNDQLLTQLSNALQPLNALVSLKVNEQIKTANSLTVNALHITLVSSGTGAPLADIILGQAKVGFAGDICNPNVGPPICPNAIDQPTDNTAATMEQLEATCGVEEPDPTLPVINTNGYVILIIDGVRTRVPVNCAHIKMHFEANHKTALTTILGSRRQVTRGLLKSCSQDRVVNGRTVHVPAGRPVIGAKIDVIHIFGGKRHPQKTGMKSRGHGRMTLILPINLTTRTLEYDYRGDLTKKTVTSRARLRLTVRTKSGKLATGTAPGPQF